jgi:phospholipase C
VLQTLISNTEVWSKTVLFISWDENDGFFDHVAPPVPPPGTAGEYVTVQPLPADAGGVAGPIGLGVRVPLLVVSPFSRGGYVASEVFDHTSQLRFLEARFGVTAPNISAWRRKTVGDLTSTLRMAGADVAAPRLPSTSADTPTGVGALGCQATDMIELRSNQAAYPIPDPQVMPAQKPGRPCRVG